MSESTVFDDFDKYEPFERETRRRYATKKEGRRKRQTQAKRWTYEDTIREVSEKLQLENSFDFTYRPAEHEAGWVLAGLQAFIREELITDVTQLVKGGKEANVYQCRANETVGTEFVAAKIYRPKMFRQLRNDSLYKEGRAVLGSDGGEVSERDRRTMKAIRHKSNFGSYMAHQSWLQHEFTTLELLHEAGAAVPKPYAVDSNAILMDFVGDQYGAAPILHSVNLRKLLPKPEIYTLFNTCIDTIELMLQYDRIHGDLSAFNILYWNENIVFIDFPQVTVASKNSRARYILQRDIQRVCEYFQKQGVNCRPRAIADALWHRYVALSRQDEQAELSRLEDNST